MLQVVLSNLEDDRHRDEYYADAEGHLHVQRRVGVTVEHASDERSHLDQRAVMPAVVVVTVTVVVVPMRIHGEPRVAQHDHSAHDE